MPNTIGIDWAATHQAKRGGVMRDFDLKVGDIVVFPDESTGFEKSVARNKLNTGKVVGIYPHVIHILYYIGPNKDIPMYRSYPIVAYRIGEVMKIG